MQPSGGTPHFPTGGLAGGTQHVGQSAIPRYSITGGLPSLWRHPPAPVQPPTTPQGVRPDPLEKRRIRFFLRPAPALHTEDVQRHDQPGNESLPFEPPASDEPEAADLFPTGGDSGPDSTN